MKRKNAVRVLIAAIAIAGVLGSIVSVPGDVSAASLSARLSLGLSGTYANPLDLGITGTAAPAITRNLDITNGVGANQADVFWSDQRTLAASAAEDLDFKAGGLVDAFGTTLNPAKVRAIVVYASSQNTNNVVLGGDANSIPFLSTAATTATIQPGGMFVITAPATAGIAVTAGTGDIIQVANSGAGTSVTYDIIVIGTSS